MGLDSYSNLIIKGLHQDNFLNAAPLRCVRINKYHAPMNEKIRWRILVKQDKMFSFNVLLPEDSSTNSQSWTYEDAM